MSLALIDWLIVIGFLLLSLTIGFVFSRRAGSNITEYFASGRSLPWWIAGTSMVATTFAADTPLAVTSLVIKHGIAGNWFWWSFAFGGMITVFVYSRLWRRAEVLTDVELIELRYGGKPATVLRVSRAAYVALIVNPIIIGWVINAMMTVLNQTVFFNAEVKQTFIGGAAVFDGLVLVGLLVAVGAYCTLSGMWGVAFTDVIQFCLAMVGCIWLAVVAVNEVGGIEKLQDGFVANFGENGAEALNFLPNVFVADPWMPAYILIILLTVNWWATWFPGAEPGGGGYVVQRMASCRSERDSVLATLWYQIAHYCLRPWPWLMIALVALVLYPELRTNYLEATAKGESYDPGIGFPMVMRRLCSPGLAGLMLVAFLAAFMSTISTQMNWGASYLVRDVYQVLRPKVGDDQVTHVSRLLSVVVLLIGGVVGWLFYQYQVNVDTAWKALAALGAGTGAVFMMRWFWWRINAWTEISAMFSALAYFSVMQFVVAPNIATDSDWAFLTKNEVIMAIVAALTIVTWLLVTFLTSPESTETLTRFYKKTRPGGKGWQPIAKQNPNIETEQNLWIGVAASVAGACLIYSILPLVGALIFKNYEQAAICATFALASGIALSFLIKKI